jgi:hypothetical protein
MVTSGAPTELLNGERADVSWITTEEPDREGEIIRAGGMNDAHFALNPLVTLNHCYGQPAVGRSLWRKKARDGSRLGIKAKTLYPPRPPDWTEPWLPDATFALIKAGLLQGKSIGFLRLKAHAPTSAEVAARPELAGVRRIVDEWLLVEYACTTLPVNPFAVVEAVSKSLVCPQDLQAVGLDLPSVVSPPFQPVTFLSEVQVQDYVGTALSQIDLKTLLTSLVEDNWDRLRGRV